MARSDTLDAAARLHSAAIRLLRGVRVVDAETGLSPLARAEQVTAPTMSKLVADLEAEGLVAKRADREDRRGVRIEVTPKGRALMEEGRRRRLALLTGRLAKLSRAERAQLDAAV